MQKKKKKRRRRRVEEEEEEDDEEEEEEEDEEDDEEEEEDEEEDEEEEEEEEEEPRRRKKRRGKRETVEPEESDINARKFKKRARKSATAGGGADRPILKIVTDEVYRGRLESWNETEYRASGEYHDKGDPIIRLVFKKGVWLIGGAHFDKKKGEMVLSPTQNTAMTFCKKHEDDFPMTVDFGQMWVKPAGRGRKYKVAHIEPVKKKKKRSR